MHHEHASLSLAQRCSGLPQGMPLFSSLLNYRHSPRCADNADAAGKGIQFVSGQERSNYPPGLSSTISATDSGRRRRCIGPLMRAELSLVVDRERARFSNWYGLFPRSAGPVPGEHGAFPSSWAATHC